MMLPVRIVNLDWLEVYCLESQESPRSAEFFRRRGYEVRVRQHGTPQYREVFTVFDGDHFPFVEVRRDPYSIKPEGGIFHPRACHVRMANRALYQPDPVADLRRFLLANDYELQSVSRADICCDFNFFDDGRDPYDFLRDFFREKYCKINQPRFSPHGLEYLYEEGKKVSAAISLHGIDKIGGRFFNSVKWGSPTSKISTKLYDKTLELKQNKPKKYIQNTWKRAGLESTDERHVWRCEFSLSSDIKNFVRLDSGEFIRFTLSTIDSRARLMVLFNGLSQTYFHFKRAVRTRNGTQQRKDRCPSYFPFRVREDQFKPVRLTQVHDPTRTDRLLVKRLLEYLRDDAGIYNFGHEEYRGVVALLRVLGVRYGEEEWEWLSEQYRDELDLLRPF